MCGQVAGLGPSVLDKALARGGAFCDEPARLQELAGGWQPSAQPPSSGCDSSDCIHCWTLARLRRPTTAAEGCWLRRKRSRTDLSCMDGGAAPTNDPSAACGTVPGSQAAEDAELRLMSREPSSSILLVPDAASPGRLPPHVTAQQVPSPDQQQQQQQPTTGPRPAEWRCSMWDHALLEESTAERVLQRRQAGNGDTNGGGSWEALALGGSDDASSSPGSSGGSGSSGAGAAAGARLGGSSDSSTWHPSWHQPAVLQEIASFLPPSPCSQHWRGAPATDIVCALEFEEHGWLLASAGVSKQVRVYSLASCLEHPAGSDDDEYEYEEPDDREGLGAGAGSAAARPARSAAAAAFRRPIRCHRMASKLSSLAWNPDVPGAVTVADYDGVVSQVDLESGHLIAEADEHSGRRVWGVSHSLHHPHLCASASEDGTVRLWAGPGLQSCAGMLRPGGGAPACGVHFSPFDANLLAVASADHCAYVFDLRRASEPLMQLAGHARAVSYVRWLAPTRLVSASTDASLAIWQLPGEQQQQQQQQPAVGLGEAAAAAAAGVQTWAPQAAATSAGAAMGTMAAHQGLPELAAMPAGQSGTLVLEQPLRRLRGHRNSKNFCGLSVRPEDCLVACGSETPACFTYHQSWSAPLAMHNFNFGAVHSSSFGAVGAAWAIPAAQQQQQRGQLQPQLPPPAPSTSSSSRSATPPPQPQPASSTGAQFCSAVCWQPATAQLAGTPLLAAALSTGELRVMELHRPAASAAARRCLDG